MSEWLTCIDVDVARGLFAVGRSDGVVILAALESGRPIHVAALHQDRVASVVFDGGMLWSAAFDGQVVGWDLERGAEVRRFDAGHGRILSLRASAEFLLTACDDGNARLWNRDGGRAIQTLDEDRFGPAYSIAATADWVAVGYQTGHVTVWTPVVGPKPWGYEGNLQAAGRGPLYGIAVAPSRELVAFARDRRVSLHEPGEWPEIDSLPIDLACNDLQFDSQGVNLIGACSDRQVALWQWQPMVDSKHGHWPHIPWTLGKGMLSGEKWAQTFICSGARFVDDKEVISSWFDGTVRVFHLPREEYAPDRVAHFGGKKPTGWQT